MATLKQDIADGKVVDEREKLEGFEKPITSKLEKKASEGEKEAAREKARQTREERKKADQAQTDFQTQLQRLKAEGKAK